MGKIEEIQQNAKNRYYEYDDDFGHYTDHQDDIVYLLSRLEIAEEAIQLALPIVEHQSPTRAEMIKQLLEQIQKE